MSSAEVDHNKNILLVEDDLMFAKLTTEKLEAELDSKVVWAKTLAETIQLLDAEDSKDYYVAVLDFVLPDAANGEIIDIVRKKGIPSIVFTGNINPKIRKFVWSKKVVDYILKDDTNSLNYLVSTIKKLISNRYKKATFKEGKKC